MESPTDGFKLTDLARRGRRGLRAVMPGAPKAAGPVTPGELIAEHLGVGAAGLPVVGEEWPAYDHVNVQAALDAWLEVEGREHRLVGLVPSLDRVSSLGDLTQSGTAGVGPRVGSVSLAQLPTGPGGEVRSCVRCGLYLVTEPDGGRLALFLFESAGQGPGGQTIQVEALGPDSERAAAALGELRRLAVGHNVFRGHVLTFGNEVFGRRGSVLGFMERPRVDRDALILPEGVLELIERQVLGVGRHHERLRASGQHLKRGLLLYGPPGTGKTHTVRYLLGGMEGVTVIVLSGHALNSIAAACSIARTLQPSAVVVEDVDLIAEQRGAGPGANPLLFELLNEMDGLGEDVDVAFVLTTNRPDLLEPALAARPGRVDQAIEIPLPDASARRRLLELYGGDLELDSNEFEPILTRTEGVTASFLKEMLRRAALLGAESGAESGAGSGDESGADAGGGSDRLVVDGGHLQEALDELLDDRARLTRVTLGGGESA